MTDTRLNWPRPRLLPGLLAGCWGSCLAAEPAVLPEVEVRAPLQQEAGWLTPDRSSPSTVYQVGRDALEVFDSPGGTNPYTAVAELPGVKVSTVDAYGLKICRAGKRACACAAK